MLDGRARPDAVIEQRKRYWLLLKEFWKDDEQMAKSFSSKVMVSDRDRER